MHSRSLVQKSPRLPVRNGIFIAQQHVDPRVGSAPEWFIGGKGFSSSRQENTESGVRIISITNCKGAFSVGPWGYSALWHLPFRRVLVSGTTDSVLRGELFLDTAGVRDMFGLGDDPRNQVNVRGRFIRHGDYLSIPCAGRRDEYDPNLCVLLTQNIRSEVEWVLARRPI